MKTNLNDSTNWVPKDIFLSYCGNKTEKIDKFYDKAVEKNKINIFTLNWLGILLLPAWLGYRRQWGIYFMVTGVIMLSFFVEAILNITLPSTGFAGATAAIGAMGYSLMLQNATKQYQKLKLEGFKDEEITQELENKASPSVMFAFLGIIGSLSLLILSAVIADYLFGLPA